MVSSLIQKDLQYIWHPFTPQVPPPHLKAIISGRGSILYDEERKAYIDAISSWWVNLHGHAHPYIAEKLYAQALQLEHVIFAGFTHPPAVELAERLIHKLPGRFARIFFSDNGSTATEVALKMAVQFWKNSSDQSGKGRNKARRTKIIALKNSYHGDTFGAMSVSDRGVFTLPFHELLFDVIFLDTPNPENLDESLALIRRHGEETACFIYEPLVQGAGGMQVYDPVSLNRLLEEMQSFQILRIADEVMTGFGRTGKNFASEYLAVEPDIICLSKGLTGGTMALGVTACQEHVYHAYLSTNKQATFFHGHSFTANPLACTAALASLDLLEEPSCIQKINWICQLQEAWIAEIKNSRYVQEGYICKPRQVGTITAFDLADGEPGYLNDIAAKVGRMAMERGIYLRPLGNVVYTMPPYCLLPAEWDKIQTTVMDILNEIH